MRLFTAVDPSPEVHENLRRLLSRLRPSADIRWSRPENLHLTLKFIGEWPDAELSALCAALEGLPHRESFQVRVGGLGFFPNPKLPRVLWVGIGRSPELARLAAEIDEALSKLGIAREQRSYSPHLTLARITDRAPLEGLHGAIRSLPATDFGSFAPDRFALYQSRPGPGGSIYTRIAEFTFQC